MHSKRLSLSPNFHPDKCVGGDLESMRATDLPLTNWHDDKGSVSGNAPGARIFEFPSGGQDRRGHRCSSPHRREQGPVCPSPPTRTSGILLRAFASLLGYHY